MNPNFQQHIRDHHSLMETALRIEDFGTSLDRYDAFINDNEEYVTKFDPQEQEYQDLTDSPELDYGIYNRNKEKAADLHDKSIVAEVVLSDSKGDKFTGKVRKCVNYDFASTGEGQYNLVHY